MLSESASHLQDISEVYGKVQLTFRKATGALRCIHGAGKPQGISVKAALGLFLCFRWTQLDRPFTSMEWQM